MTTATKASAKATTPAQPEKRAGRKPAAKAAAPAASGKLRWRVLGDGPGKVATVGDRTYSLLECDGGKWMSTITEGGKTTTLVEGVGGGRAYAVAVKHFKTGELPR